MLVCPKTRLTLSMGIPFESAKVRIRGTDTLIFLEPKHGCGSPPRCHIHFIDWVGQGTLYSLDLPQTDKNLGYPWIFGEIIVTLQP